MSMTNAIIIETEGLAEETVANIRDAVAAILSKASTPDPAAVLGWTGPAVLELLKRLEDRHRPVQAAVIAEIAHNAGHVDRTEVYRLGKYPESRRLTSFTKPVRGVMRDMVREGLITAGAASPLVPEYDPTNPSFQKALGFRMPPELAELIAGVVPRPETD